MGISFLASSTIVSSSIIVFLRPVYSSSSWKYRMRICGCSLLEAISISSSNSSLSMFRLMSPSPNTNLSGVFLVMQFRASSLENTDNSSSGRLTRESFCVMETMESKQKQSFSRVSLLVRNLAAFLGEIKWKIFFSSLLNFLSKYCVSGCFTISSKIQKSVFTYLISDLCWQQTIFSFSFKPCLVVCLFLSLSSFIQISFAWVLGVSSRLEISSVEFFSLILLTQSMMLRCVTLALSARGLRSESGFLLQFTQRSLVLIRLSNSFSAYASTSSFSWIFWMLSSVRASLVVFRQVSIVGMQVTNYFFMGIVCERVTLLLDLGLILVVVRLGVKYEREKCACFIWDMRQEYFINNNYWQRLPQCCEDCKRDNAYNRDTLTFGYQTQKLVDRAKTRHYVQNSLLRQS